jgi:hypothetical protein
MKNKRFEVRVNEDEKRAWTARAFARNFRSVSEWLRDLARKDCAPDAVTPSDGTFGRTAVYGAGSNPAPGDVVPAVAQQAADEPNAPLQSQQGAVVPVQRSAQTPCSRFFLHRPGVFCKECGST